MTKQEAKDWLEAISCTTIDGVHKKQRKEALFMGMQALEKQIAKKPKKQTWKLLLDDGWEYECPSCGAAIGVNKKDTLDLTQHETYCPECGHKLDWSNENE